MEVEVHVYWRGAICDRVIVKHGDEYHSLPYVTQVLRRITARDTPVVEVQLVGRLIEHRERDRGE